MEKSRHETLEEQKLAVEVRLLQKRERWEVWKSVTAVLVPVVALLALIGGGVKYFWEDSAKQHLRREEIYLLGVKELGSADEDARLAAATTLLAYVGKEKGYDERVVAILALQVAKETSVVIRQTLLRNLRRWRATDRELFDGFVTSVRNELRLIQVNTEKSNATDRGELGKQREILERVEALLGGL